MSGGQAGSVDKGLPPPWQRRPWSARGGVRRTLQEDDLAQFLPDLTVQQCAALSDGTIHVEYVTDDDGSAARIEIPVMDNTGLCWLWVLTTAHDRC